MKVEQKNEDEQVPSSRQECCCPGRVRSPEKFERTRTQWSDVLKETLCYLRLNFSAVSKSKGFVSERATEIEDSRINQSLNSYLKATTKITTKGGATIKPLPSFQKEE